MIRLLRLRCERGAATIEYALIAALIALAMVQGAAGLGGSTSGLWSDVDEETAAALETAESKKGKGPKKPKKK